MIPKRLLTREVRLEEVNRDYTEDPNFTHLRYMTRFVGSVGGTQPIVMFVSTIPDVEESAGGKAGCGKAGRLLIDAIRSIDLNMTQVYLTNVVRYRPHEGRDPRPSEITLSLPYLWREMDILHPRVVIPIGRFSTSLFFADQLFAELHGTVTVEEDYSYVPITSPHTVLQNPLLRTTLMKDILAVGQLV